MPLVLISFLLNRFSDKRKIEVFWAAEFVHL